MLCSTVRLANCVVWSATLFTAFPLAAAPVARPYAVDNYDVSIQPDLANQLLDGEVKIRFHSQSESPVSALEFDAGGLRIASVLEGPYPQSFERDRGLLFVVLTNPLRQDEPRTITIRYQTGPAPGLKFFPDQIYTSVTSDWMPCNDRPGERATLHLTITAPVDSKADMKVAASGQLTATRAAEGKSITEWQLDSPAEPSWFGFALGAFTENTSEAEGVKLRALGAGAGVNKEIFDPAAAAIHYLADRTGKHYPGPMYTQVFVHGDVSRAMAAGLTLLPESYAQGLAKQPQDLWLLANELACQWYGIEVAPKDWSDLWLSKGVTAFLADAFLGQRAGKEAYERELQHARQMYDQLRKEGKDRPLSNTGWTTQQDADNGIPEYKGAWFLYLLNQLVGDSAFWNGLQLYTADQWGHAATSEDFQKAFEAEDTGSAPKRKGRGKQAKNAVKPLDNLFDMWVYGISNAPLKN